MLVKDARWKDARWPNSAARGEVPVVTMRQKNMGVASRVADYAHIPALHEGRGMVAGRKVNVSPAHWFPRLGGKTYLCKVVALALARGRPDRKRIGVIRRSQKDSGPQSHRLRASISEAVETANSILVQVSYRLRLK